MADEKTNPLSEEATESPCKRCQHFLAGVPRVVCREYPDCLLNSQIGSPHVRSKDSLSSTSDDPGKRSEPAIEFRECTDCHKSKPWDKDHFSSNRYGLMSICKECMAKKRAAGIAQKKKKKTQMVAANTGAGKKQMKKPVSRRNHQIEFDEKYKDLIVDIKRYAEEDIRSFPDQVVFILREYRDEREKSV